ncbi:hypothetical protein B5M47_03845 [candidate division CPR3 bacterium 4484_211]|uniref:Uncharacterized protein n=1 Tax=candidate division CPR3 bacterium 4484_211 TaxID=1968527 RepID=A0A1W9NW54_UNCC3|nr:MAG: hypothetical protein B5M47_03845 [candidate division CPR3 bacterium 4484_211]
MQQIFDTQQLNKIIDSSQNILVISGDEHNFDKISSVLALRQVLKGQGKSVRALAENLDASRFSAVPGISDISSCLEPRTLRVLINYGSEAVEKINYDNREGVFEVIMSPFEGEFSKDKIDLVYSGLDYDLIFAIGASTVEDLGAVYRQHAQVFKNIVVVNIDTDAANTMFGKINVVDSSAETQAQLVYDVIKSLDAPFDSRIATLLLIGVMERTKRFNQDVSSRLLRFSASLLDKGANWQKALAAVLPSQPAKEKPAEQGEATPREDVSSKPIVPLAQKLPAGEDVAPKEIDDAEETIR